MVGVTLGKIIDYIPHPREDTIKVVVSEGDGGMVESKITIQGDSIPIRTTKGHTGEVIHSKMFPPLARLIL